jgi:hypothetical protein
MAQKVALTPGTSGGSSTPDADADPQAPAAAPPPPPPPPVWQGAPQDAAGSPQVQSLNGLNLFQLPRMQDELTDLTKRFDASKADVKVKLATDEATLKAHAAQARAEWDAKKAELHAHLTADVAKLAARAKLNVNAFETRAQAEAKRTGQEIELLREKIRQEIDQFQGVYARDSHLPAVRRRHFQPPPAPPGSNLAVGGAAAPVNAAPVLSVNGIQLETYGASPAAVAEARSALALETARPDIAARLASRHVAIVIIPQSVRMTDLPEFANLRGQKTFDGRPWEDVRGVGGTPLSDGRVVVGIAEEDLAKLPGDQYPSGFSVAKHEIGHVIQDYGLPPQERQATIDDYNAFVRALGANPTLKDDPQYYGNPHWYGNANYQEHWAMGTNLFTGTDEGEGPVAGQDALGGPRWVYGHDPKLYGHLSNAYPGITGQWPKPGGK